MEVARDKRTREEFMVTRHQDKRVSWVIDLVGHYCCWSIYLVVATGRTSKDKQGVGTRCTSRLGT
jgi:hypothetical protein